MSIVCLVLHAGIFGTYLILSTLLIPCDLHQSDTCKRAVEFALVVYLMSRRYLLPYTYIMPEIYVPGRHILENYTGNTRVFGVVVVYFLRKYTVYFPCNSRVPTEITRITREIATPQWRNDGEITLIC